MSDSKPKFQVSNLPNDYSPVLSAKTARIADSVAETGTLAMFGGCDGEA
jgi:hypothetical protein